VGTTEPVVVGRVSKKCRTGDKGDDRRGKRLARGKEKKKPPHEGGVKEKTEPQIGKVR